MEYPTKNTVVYEDYAIRVLCFKENNEHRSTLLLSAIAGHTSQFSVDFQKDKSLAQCAVENCAGGVFSICIKPPTVFSRWVVTYDSLIEQIKTAIEVINNGKVHLAGICQGGALASKFATKYPNLLDELSIAASPIDTSFESVLTPAQKIPFYVYQSTVVGCGWVMSGKLMLDAWMSHNPELHERERKKPENAYFYSCYMETQDINPMPYLWMIYNVFIENLLLSTLNIKCKVNTLVGETDEITPPRQTTAIQERCAEEITQYSVSGGHMCTFGSGEAMEPGGVWSTIFGGG